jgi:hypothetical protein
MMNDEFSRSTKATLAQGMQKEECRMQKGGEGAGGGGGGTGKTEP